MINNKKAELVAKVDKVKPSGRPLLAALRDDHPAHHPLDAVMHLTSHVVMLRGVNRTIYLTDVDTTTLAWGG